MEITSVAEGAQSAVQGTAAATPGRDEFLRLLVTQLRAQDPLEPIKNEQFVAQLAQFSVVERLEEVADISRSQAGMEAAGLIGKTVAGVSEGKEIEGRVERLEFSGQQTLLHLDNGVLPLADLRGVR